MMRRNTDSARQKLSAFFQLEVNGQVSQFFEILVGDVAQLFDRVGGSPHYQLGSDFEDLIAGFALKLVNDRDFANTIRGRIVEENQDGVIFEVGHFADFKDFGFQCAHDLPVDFVLQFAQFPDGRVRIELDIVFRQEGAVGDVAFGDDIAGDESDRDQFLVAADLVRFDDAPHAVPADAIQPFSGFDVFFADAHRIRNRTGQRNDRGLTRQDRFGDRHRGFQGSQVVGTVEDLVVVVDLHHVVHLIDDALVFAFDDDEDARRQAVDVFDDAIAVEHAAFGFQTQLFNGFFEVSGNASGIRMMPQHEYLESLEHMLDQQIS